MLRSIPLILLAAAAVFAPCVATAEIVATCGASSGYGYYIPGPLNPERKATMEKDAVSRGSFQLIHSGNDWDIIFTDSTGGTLSSKGDGGEISGVVTSSGDVLVVIAYERTIETWIFWLSQAQPSASYSQAKFDAGIKKHSLMVAQCKRGSVLR